MLKAALAGALALVAVGIAPALADGPYGDAAGVSISEGQIVQAKAALRLTPDQERHWPRVAAALRALSRQMGRPSSDDDGFVQNVRASAAAAAAKANGARRVLAAAMPLIRTLDAEQKQTARSMVRSLGYGHLASRL